MSAATPSTATRSTPATMATSRLAKLPVSVACGFAAAAGAVVLYGYGTLAQAPSTTSSENPFRTCLSPKLWPRPWISPCAPAK